MSSTRTASSTSVRCPFSVPALCSRSDVKEHAGPLYYVYMSMLSTFCTNSINILAGVNGVEVCDLVAFKAGAPQI